MDRITNLVRRVRGYNASARRDREAKRPSKPQHNRCGLDTIPRHPHHSALVNPSLQQIDTQALYSWLMAPNYTTWYIRISHLYLEPLPPGDLPRPAKLNAIIHEEAEVDGQRTTTLVTNTLDIRQLIRALMASGDIPHDSHRYTVLCSRSREYTFLSPISEMGQ
ncbi:hypothetical protein TSUD_394450 [Trifolium subterraneum]|uniref:Uncharacterized protein n=1 Tax=Trifolium subterraneum TaxID=3900 RepID=A0A2Z6NTD4_TRISU|nr:hypothetical protein TSUD_394450 [Trifolium subterraneum]